MKGIVDIKVFDKDGNLKQHETGENMITKKVYKCKLFILYTLFYNVNSVQYE